MKELSRRDLLKYAGTVAIGSLVPGLFSKSIKAFENDSDLTYGTPMSAAEELVKYVSCGLYDEANLVLANEHFNQDGWEQSYDLHNPGDRMRALGFTNDKYLVDNFGWPVNRRYLTKEQIEEELQPLFRDEIFRAMEFGLEWDQQLIREDGSLGPVEYRGRRFIGVCFDTNEPPNEWEIAMGRSIPIRPTRSQTEDDC